MTKRDLLTFLEGYDDDLPILAKVGETDLDIVRVDYASNGPELVIVTTRVNEDEDENENEDEDGDGPKLKCPNCGEEF